MIILLTDRPKHLIFNKNKRNNNQTELKKLTKEQLLLDGIYMTNQKKNNLLTMNRYKKILNSALIKSYLIN